jgi:gamma-glutamylaminecyclotransferase
VSAHASAPPGSLFVYGSLMRGQLYAGKLEGAGFIGPAITAAAYTLIDLGTCPGLVAGGRTAVAGELYRVQPDHLRELDRFEEHPHVYRRGPLVLSDGTAVEAYLYVRAQSASIVVRSGDWRRHRQEAT